MSPSYLASLRDAARWLAQEMGRADFLALLKVCLLWGVLGAIVGLCLGLGAYRLFRRARWYDSRTTTTRWVHRSLGVITTGLVVLLLGTAGAWEGVHREAPGVIERGRIGRELLPQLADFLSLQLARLDLLLRTGGKSSVKTEEAYVAEFVAGKREIDVPALLQRMQALQKEIYATATAELESRARAEMPWLRGAPGQKFLHHVVSEVTAVLLDHKLSTELQRHGMAQTYDAVRHRLEAEAARTGNPATIGQRDLAAFIQREGLVPAFIAPIRSFARQQQILCGVLAVLTCILPAVVCRIARPRASAPTPAPAV
jgi:hypothetical protein